ncbi:ent-kaurenoic acid oxidase 2-like [Macadamia integrifolia]|uniref:ent-kaurenoic acid oxidase 2-like n=1 Tax=Macadamia integrifolia TaxID=60698 RepID=UPI001C4FC146|nr:ent-kaurenoic acid oxidase 2-like [Macadamia integrifolia]
MESSLVWVGLTVLFGGLVAFFALLKNVNSWLYESKLGEKRFNLPPGDMGWPLIGNMWTFLGAFKSNEPDSFFASYYKKFGRSRGVYRAFMFGSPSIMVTAPEPAKQVLMDDENFGTGWPKSTLELIGKKSFLGISDEEHRRLRKLTAASVNGHEALSIYMKFIEETAMSTLDKWSKMGEIEFLTELRRFTFRIIMHIFLKCEDEQVLNALEKEYTALNYGVRAMTINIPGFAYHKALKARKNLVAAFQSTVTERRQRRAVGIIAPTNKRKDMMDSLLEVKDEKGRELSDEEIIDVLLMYLNAGHESSGHITMWATLFLLQHPEIFKKAKAEQEEVVKNRPAGQNELTLRELRQMDYLGKVVDETLRIINISLVVFREARKDMNLSGYLVPKGWKVLVWLRTVNLDLEIYPNPKEFNPSRWDDYIPKPGTFLPFGAGARLCPGNDLAKLEIMIFLHHFLLNYQLEWLNPGCSLNYLPHTRPMDNCRARIKKVSSPAV